MSYMHCEKDPNLPTYLSPKSKDAVFNDDELCHIVLDQREVRRKLRDKESLSPDEILNLELQARNLYLDYKAKEAVVYKNVSSPSPSSLVVPYRPTSPDHLVLMPPTQVST